MKVLTSFRIFKISENLGESDILFFTSNETLIIPDIPEEELEIKPPWSE